MHPLIGKPTHEDTVFEKPVTELNAVVAFRSLDPAKDLHLLHTWMNAEYARRFWGLRGSPETIQHVYATAMASPQAHAFIGLIDGEPFCQVDAYAISGDELENHIADAGAGDAGMHILMCPPRQMKRRWSYWAIKCFQQYYFFQEGACRLFAEPDQRNHPANQLAINTGFRLVSTIELSYKTANLYGLTREAFLHD